MHNGIFWGYIGLIEGLVSRIKAEYGTDMRVIGTGGLAALFSDCTDAIDQVDEDLTLHGVRRRRHRRRRRTAARCRSWRMTRKRFISSSRGFQ